MGFGVNMTGTKEQGRKSWITRRERYGLCGVKDLEKTKNNNTVAARKTWSNPDFIERMKSIHNSESYKNNVSKSAKLAYQRLGVKEKHLPFLNKNIEEKIKNNKSLEGRYKNSLGMKKRWLDPIYREKNILACKEACKKPEVMERKIKAIKKQRKYNTIPEQILESIVKSLGYCYELQYPIGNISCADGFVKPNYVFYADGRYWHGSHFPKQQIKDIEQTKKLTNLGYVVLRFSEDDLKKNPEKVKQNIIDIIQTSNICIKHTTLESV